MEKAIEIKRRAQRCIQNGDLDGALNEYEKLVATEDSDPYNYVLLADLLFKKGDTAAAASRYLSAAEAYEKAGLYKNGIAVCKKMMRLSLSTSPVLQRLAVLHELDGIATEAALYYSQYAENMVREDHLEKAVEAFRKAFDTSPENVKALERLAEVHALLGAKDQAAAVLHEAATHYQRAGKLGDADRCRNRATGFAPGAISVESPAQAPAIAAVAGAGAVVDAGHSLGEAVGTVLPGSDRFATPSEPPAASTLDLDTDDAGPLAVPLETESEADPWFESTAASPSANGAVAEPPAPPRLAAPSPAPAAGHAVENGDAPSAPPVFEMPDAGGPGLQFGSPAETPAPAEAPADEDAGEGEDEAAQEYTRVEELLAQAQAMFRTGNREAAGLALAEAAREYDTVGQHDSAATIYRSLSKGAHVGAEIMMAWLRNCELRNDRLEAAQVTCELGDRALNDGENDAARRWFERAIAFDPGNAHAQRRLQRLSPQSAEPAAPAEPAATPAEPAPPMEMGRVEVAVGRGEAVTFDLGSLVNEFQRGVEMQLSGDAQGQYDIGMAYREMGLLEQAVDAFRAAASEPHFAARAAEMIGRCLLDQGRFDDAALEFSSALKLADAAPELVADLRYQLGLAHEAAGRLEDALAEFEAVFAAQSNYPDVALKIRVLRKTLGRG